MFIGSRRQVLLGVLCMMTVGCAKQAPPGAERVRARELSSSEVALRSAASPLTLPQAEVTWTYASTAIGPMSAVVVVPERTAEQRFPVLLTFHGMGEARKGAARGARGWIDDYGLLRAVERLRRPPLTAEDLQGFVEPERLRKLNQALLQHPYRGLIVVNSYTPDMLRGDEPFSKIPPLAKFVLEELLPRVAREMPALATAQATGIDGISLGGRAALAIALRHPQAFAAAGGLQPAFDLENAGPFAELALAARKKNPSLSLRLLSSEGDYFLASTRAISSSLRQAKVPHTLVVVPGPHDYPFNRGPAVYEMLLHHDRVLRGLPPI